MVVDRALARLESLPRTAPTHALHGLLPREVEILVKSVVVPVRGLGGRVTGLASRTLVPRTVRCLVDEGALAGIRHAPLLPACGLGGPGPGRSLQTATSPIEFTHALRVTVCGLDECACVHLAVTRPGVTGCGHTGPANGHVTIAGHETIHPFPLTVRSLRMGVGSLSGVAGIARRQLLPPGIAATLGRGRSLPLRLRVAPFLGSRPLCRTLPGCSSACQGPLRSGMQLWGLCFRLLASPVLPVLAAPVTSAAPVACSSASVPAPGVVSSAGAASATGSPGRHERARVSPRSERRLKRSSGRERSLLGTKRGKGWSSSPARSARLARASASSLFASSDADERASVMPPPPRWTSWHGW